MYEVFWADCLPDEKVDGTFDHGELAALAWFPRLNNQDGLYERPRRGTLASAILTNIALFPLQIALATFAVLPPVRKILDRVLADVTNYLHSAATMRFSAPAADDPGVAIHRRLSDTLQKVRDDRCQKLLIVAHSLGSVIAITRCPAGSTPPGPSDRPRAWPRTCP